MAHRTGVDTEGTTTRRFVHRTLLEHFVAQKVAAMDTKTAVEVLLPHLWFDADWELAAPAAISAHPDRSQLLV